MAEIEARRANDFQTQTRSLTDDIGARLFREAYGGGNPKTGDVGGESAKLPPMPKEFGDFQLVAQANQIGDATAKDSEPAAPKRR